MASYPPCPPAARFFDRLAAEEAALRNATRSVNDLHAAIRSGDVKRIEAERVGQEIVAEQLRAASEERERAGNLLADSLGLPRTGLCLSQIAEKLPGRWADDARAAQKRLAAVSGELAEAVRRNATLVSGLRSYLRGVLADLTGVGPPAIRYGSAGTLVGAGTAGFLARG